jgi:hypothetical protein
MFFVFTGIEIIYHRPKSFDEIKPLQIIFADIALESSIGWITEGDLSFDDGDICVPQSDLIDSPVEWMSFAAVKNPGM